MPTFKLKPEKTATNAMIEARVNKLGEFEDGCVRNAPSSPLHVNLRTLREKLDLQKNEMAELIKVTPRTYYAYEQGLRPIPSGTLIRLAIVTGADMNQILLGRAAPTNLDTVRSAVDDMMLIIKFLATEYPDMDLQTRQEVSRFAVTTDWQGWSRMHPSVIRDAVRLVTRYRFHPEDIPPPPFHEDYGNDQEQWERDMAEWQRIVDEDLPSDKE
ncbi:helix-turn-helix transcriptional regulator [Phaeobacter sp. CNT1-3]|nr:helix-turn-helix transcriptional regulator [Phaeobacter sp. CNT1-3]